MKTSLIIATLLFLISSGSFERLRQQQVRFSQAQQNIDRDRELREANDLSSEVLRLYHVTRYKEAIPLAQRVVEIRRRLLSGDDVSLGSAFTNLAELYFAQKNMGEAEKDFQQALSVYQQHAEQNGALLSKALERIGYLRFLNGDYDRADSMYLRSLVLREKIFGATDYSTVEAMKSYACLDLVAHKGKHSEGDPEQSDATRRDVMSRARCWLYGFKEGCENVSYHPTATESPSVVNGKAIKLVTPEYPREKVGELMTGSIFVAVRIDEEGSVAEAKAVCGGPPAFVKAGVEAARKSRFTKTMLDGKPVAVNGLIVYNFVQR